VSLGGGVSRPGGHPHVETILINFFQHFLPLKKIEMVKLKSVKRRQKVNV
jgi:hypothetical protein